MSLRPPRRPPDDEQRMIVLCCLKYLAPCSELQLLQFLSECDCMNYFDMMFALNDLCARGQAVRRKNRAGIAYELTEAGREAVVLFGNRAPRSIVIQLEEKSAKWRQRFEMEAQCAQTIRETEKGDYEVTLSLMEQEADMMKLSLSLPSYELASALSVRWPEKAGEIYETVIRILAGEDA